MAVGKASASYAAAAVMGFMDSLHLHQGREPSPLADAAYAGGATLFGGSKVRYWHVVWALSGGGMIIVWRAVQYTPTDV